MDYSFKIFDIIVFISIKSLSGFMSGFPCKIIMPYTIDFSYFSIILKRKILKNINLELKIKKNTFNREKT